MAEQEFRYGLPDTNASSRWSDLSGPAREALTAQAIGPSPADLLLPGHEAALLGPEAREWAEAEIGKALESWRKYEDNLLMVPESVDELIGLNPNHAETIAALFKARQEFLQNGDTASQGKNLGETMHLVLIPWGDFQQDVSRLDTWITRWRGMQGKTRDTDEIHWSIMNAIDEDKPLYRDPYDPARLLTPSAYLRHQVDENGIWGMMLAQTSNEAGVLNPSIKGQSPDALTGEGGKNLMLGDYNVDAMGIFEWLSLTFQKNPAKVSARDSSLLLANRVETDIGPRVPAGHWEPGLEQVVVELQIPMDGKEDTRPRLAVIHTGSRS